MSAYNPIASMQRLEAAGFKRAQAEALADELRDAMSNLVTNEQLTRALDALESRLSLRMDALEGKLTLRIDGLENKMNGLENKMDGLENKMDGLEDKLTLRICGIRRSADPRLRRPRAGDRVVLKRPQAASASTFSG